ncbi:hypothetical protein FGO68_gene4529 [Halteria grandinella]|uniref:Protein kinase domain-containing protein n=1 Tax=Halteria grandinella TaxID=5974 RepID=A0A8J8NFT0_HALGN|nr:hypothetical protein FGO68_gene4529 [Halteria grandinella]
MGEEILFEENKHKLNSIFCNVPEQDRMLKNDLDEKSFTKVHQQNYQKILKIELTDDQQIQQVKKIADTLISISQTNPNIVKIIGADINEQEPKIQYEWCDENLQLQLYQKNKNNNHFSPSQALKIIKQIINGYKSLNSKKFIHKKLKPSNILFKGGTYKVYCLKQKYSQLMFLQAKNQIQNIDLISILQIMHLRKYYKIKHQQMQQTCIRYKFIVIQLGIIFYELIFGWTPYKVQSFSDALKITSKLIKYPIKCDLEGHVFKESQLLVEIKVLVESMVLFNQEERITWKDLFNHPLIKNKYLNDKMQLIFEFQTIQFNIL